MQDTHDDDQLLPVCMCERERACALLSAQRGASHLRGIEGLSNDQEEVENERT